ncbi:hypothetical protein PV08_03981 [Exophiala spinifera]|uniref:Uncharacterized protein n=1 Tax=Exophiala spinifera TaxID=91928 RepID=A0A0D1YNU1_9EURO|nr:uncharacterized protein PV08_03981 [Exophiala spinifera]KIW16791.1 hypothetical protein PV08_03981 [Exophiala spinifera]
MPPPSNLPPPPTPHPLRYAQDAARSIPGNNRKSRPLTYALGIAGIAGSGALIGAILNMSSQRQSQQNQTPLQPLPQAQSEGQAESSQLHLQPQSQPRAHLAPGVDYSQALQTLETKRGHLMAQKMQLERRINDLHETRRRRQQQQAEEEHEKERDSGQEVK